MTALPINAVQPVRNVCPVCGNYRIDGEPPTLHKCQQCGYVGGSVVHTGQCPGCLYLASKDST